MLSSYVFMATVITWWSFFWIFDLCSGTRYNTLKKRTASFRVTEMVQVNEEVIDRINCVTYVGQSEGI